MRNLTPIVLTASLLGVGCGDVTRPTVDNEQEVITTVVLSFTPIGGGAVLESTWADRENDGSPVIDEVVLQDADDYTLEVRFLNELEEPPEDLTAEVEEESDQHQVFFTGTASDGLLAHAYDDQDTNGFPVGLSSTITTVGPGTGTLTVTLRHVPPQDGDVVKTGDLADLVASGGLEALPGETDASVDFQVSVE